MTNSSPLLILNSYLTLNRKFYSLYSNFTKWDHLIEWESISVFKPINPLPTNGWQINSISISYQKTKPQPTSTTLPAPEKYIALKDLQKDITSAKKKYPVDA